MDDRKTVPWKPRLQVRGLCAGGSWPQESGGKGAGVLHADEGAPAEAESGRLSFRGSDKEVKDLDG